MSENVARTSPSAYGSLEVVCRGCGKANDVAVEVGPEGRQWWPVKCEGCGNRETLVVEVGP